MTAIESNIEAYRCRPRGLASSHPMSLSRDRSRSRRRNAGIVDAVQNDQLREASLLLFPMMEAAAGNAPAASGGAVVGNVAGGDVVAVDIDEAHHDTQPEAPAPGPEIPSPSAIDAMVKADLKHLLSSHGISSSGKVSDLAARAHACFY